MSRRSGKTKTGDGESTNGATSKGESGNRETGGASQSRGAKPLNETSKARDLNLCVIAGEHSGDQLGGKLMAAINQSRGGTVHYSGVGGREMAARGLLSLFPLEDVAVMGLGAIAAQLPRLIARVNKSVDHVVSSQPDAVVIIDSPEFTHPIAKRIRKRAPHIPIIDYVSPSVWAWRSGRARKMRGYIDHVLALLPFEPRAHEQLGGPPCSYVGHPLVERIAWIKALDTAALASRLGLSADRPVLVVLPGSRSSEISKLMQPFGETIASLIAQGIKPQLIMPVVPAKRAQIEEHLATWPLKPQLVESEEDKFTAFRLGQAALAASGTVTLELAVAGTPMVVGYKVGQVTYQVMRRLVRAKSAVLANLILGDNAFPEFIHDTCTADHLAPALADLLHETPARRAQLAALARIPEALAVPGGSPSGAAAEIVLRYGDCGRGIG